MQALSEEERRALRYLHDHGPSRWYRVYDASCADPQEISAYRFMKNLERRQLVLKSGMLHGLTAHGAEMLSAR